MPPHIPQSINPHIFYLPKFLLALSIIRDQNSIDLFANFCYNKASDS